MRVSILQSNYLPWRGYFDIIANSDVCVFLDSVQYTKNDWRNRTRLRAKDGSLRWQSIPVGKSISRKINEVELPRNGWQKKHLESFTEAYSSAPWFDICYQLYSSSLEAETRSLSRLNQAFIKEITHTYFSEDVRFLADTNLDIRDGGIDATARLLTILRLLEADTYLSGPAAKAYLNESKLLEHGVKTKFADYSVYRPYPQGKFEFSEGLTILDLICWVGHGASDHLAYGRLFRQ